MTLGIDKPDDLITALSNENMFWRTTAQRLLVERDNRDVLPQLYDLANQKKVDSLGLNPGALHALWAIQGLGAIGTEQKANTVLVASLGHPSYAVLKAAVEILPNNGSNMETLLKADLIHDKDPRVQLAAILYLSKNAAFAEIGRILYGLSKEEAIKKDPWLAKAVYITASKHPDGFLASYKKDSADHGNKG